MRLPFRILITQKFAGLAGSQVSLVYHLTLMDRSRFEPYVVVSNTGWLTTKLDELGVRWSLMQFGQWTKPLYMPRNLLAVFRLRQLIRHEKIDLVHVNEHFIGPQSLLAAKWAGVPVVCHFRTGLADLTPARIRKYLYRNFDRVLPVADVLRRRLVAHLPDASKVIVVRDGVEAAADTARDPRGGGRRVLINIGAIYPVKGQAKILQLALPWLKADRKRYLVFVGTPGGADSYVEDMKRVVRAHALERQVLFLGSRRDVPRLLGFAHALVAYSTVEGIPRVVMEAMFSGRPVIVSNTAGMEEVVIDGEVGRIVDMDAPGNLLLPVLQSVGDDLAKWKSMGQRAAEIAAERYSTKAMSKELQAIYAELLRMNENA